MPAITFSGMASGLPPDIVERLMEAEKIPLRNINNKKEKSQSQLDLVTDLETKLRAITGTIGQLASRKGFNDIKLDSGDVNVVQGTVDPNNVTKGSWNIEVLELAQKSAAITVGFPDKDETEVGVGYFRFQTPNGNQEVYIGGEHNTLEGVSNAINSANVGVRANVINDRKDSDNPYKLMISGEGLGGDQQIKFPTLYFLDGDQDLYFSEERQAKNGVMKVDGFEFEISSNTVDDVIQGVTLELKQASPGKTVNISVSEDKEVVSSKVNEFVKAINGVLNFIQNQNRLNESSDTTRTLGGDSILRTIEGRLRRLIQNPQMGLKGKVKRLSQLGIQFNRKGTLDFNTERFGSLLASGSSDVHEFFAGDGFKTGFISSLKANLNTVLDSSFGPIPIRKKAMQAKIRRFDDQLSRKESQLEKKEISLRRKFAKLEETMSRLKSQAGQVAAIQGSAVAPLQVSGG